MNRNRWMSIVLTMTGLAALDPAAFAADANVLVHAKAGSEAFVKAFNEHDAAAVGALFPESADFAGPWKMAAARNVSLHPPREGPRFQAGTASHPAINGGSSSRGPRSSGRTREGPAFLGIALDDGRSAPSDRLIRKAVVADRVRSIRTSEQPAIASDRDPPGHAIAVDPISTECTARIPVTESIDGRDADDASIPESGHALGRWADQ